MNKTVRTTLSLHKTQKGVTLLEYAMIGALISIVCLSSVTYFGRKSEKKFEDTALVLYYVNRYGQVPGFILNRLEPGYNPMAGAEGEGP